MLRLLTADFSGAPPTSIARSTGLTKVAVSMAIGSLEEAGLAERRFVAVERRFVAGERRSVMVYLTEEGRRKAEAMQDALVDFSEDVKKREGRVHP
jgi:DNA-binding MarR family transcriptional regulator